MQIVTITGGSDDLIEIGGDISEEFTISMDASEAGVYLAFSEGTLLKAVYDGDGIWRITQVAKGSAEFAKQEGIVFQDTNDIVKLTGNIDWVALADCFSLRKG